MSWVVGTVVASTVVVSTSVVAAASYFRVFDNLMVNQDGHADSVQLDASISRRTKHV